MELGRKKTDGDVGRCLSGRKGGEGPIVVRNNKLQRLGPEWSISEVGTPPPHNLDKPHGLVASINKNNNNHQNKDLKENLKDVSEQ